MKELLLGIDIGTSSCKAAAFDRGGRAAARASRPYGTSHPRPGWAEQSPGDWWAAAVLAIRDLWEQGAAPSDIAGVGVSGQSWSAVAVDGAGDALCDTPIWYDTRALSECERLKERMGWERIFRLCGNPVQPTYTLPKILWYRENLPGVYARTAKILQSNSYAVLKLTGEATQDISQGYGLFCFDIARGAWDAGMAREMGMDLSLLCEPMLCHAVAGTVTPEAALATGLLAGTPVVAGGLDAACGALGAGAFEPGQTQEQGGTSGGMYISAGTCLSHPKLILSFHATGDRWLLQGGTVGGGGVLKWLERELCAAERAEAAGRGAGVYDVINEECAAVPPGCEGLVFLPYMAGERSPVWDPHARGVFFGLDYGKTRAHMLRAGMEGAAYSLKHNLDTAAEAGVAVGRMLAVGGAANSKLWTQIKADVTGLPIAVPSSDMASALGAAMLAGVGTGVFESFGQAVRDTVRIVRSHEPDMEKHGIYRKSYQTYLEIYRQLKGTMAAN